MLEDKGRNKGCVELVAIQVPDDVGDEERGLEREREPCGCPEFPSCYPKEDVRDDVCDYSPFNGHIERANETFPHISGLYTRYRTSRFIKCAQ